MVVIPINLIEVIKINKLRELVYSIFSASLTLSHSTDRIMKKSFIRFILIVTSIISFVLSFNACDQTPKKVLPILGPRELVESEINGKLQEDTIYHSIADFNFIDQNGEDVNAKTVENKIYVADFFFASCPTICPKMHAQMLRVYEATKENDNLIFISHTMDPDRDTVEVLKLVAEKVGSIDSKRWHFVTGVREEIFQLGNKSYMAALSKDPDAPGGNLHSGAFILVDKQRRIRGFYDGTRSVEVDVLIKDIGMLSVE